MAQNRTAQIIVAITTVSAAIMQLIDSSIVNVALNQMAGNLGASIDDISWVVTSYAIASVIIIPLTGFLAKQFGRKNYYMASIILFTVSSALCGNSSSLGELIFFRFIQGLGGGALLSTSQAILFDAFPREQRGLAGALYGTGVILGPSLGPICGGIIIDNYTWPLIFYINIPFGIAATLLAYRYVTNDNKIKTEDKVPVDWIGILSLTVGVASLQYVLERGRTEDWFSSGKIILFSFLAFAGLTVFIWYELNTRNPVVNLRIFRNRNFSMMQILMLITGFVLFTSIYTYPLLAQRVLRFTTYMTGIELFPSALASMVIMPLVGRRLQAGTPPKIIIAMGYGILMLFGGMMSKVNLDATGQFFFVPLMMRGAGMALLMAPLTSLAVSGLTKEETPDGIAINNMMRQVGGSFGIAVVNSFIARRYATHWNDLITNIYNNNPLFSERNALFMHSIKSKLTVTANLQQQCYQLVGQIIDRQSYLLSYIDTFLFVSCVILVAFPVLALVSDKKYLKP